MKRLFSAVSVAAVLVGVLAGPATATVPATVVATINGGGTANMEDGAGSSVFGVGVKLLSDGSATGSFDCLDQHGDRPGYPGNIFGHVTSWSIDDGIVSLNVIGKLVPIPGGLVARDLAFTVKIQRFGGAGVGHWTLEIDGVIYCFEILTSGQIVMRPA
jgi:hypothetical protein